MGGLDVGPGLLVKTTLRLLFAEDVIQFQVLALLQTKFIAQLGVEIQGILQQVAVMGPDDLVGRGSLAPGHVEVLVGFF